MNLYGVFSKSIQDPNRYKKLYEALEARYPIASRVLWKEELLKGAILTRLATSAARIVVNTPQTTRKIELTRAQKHQSFWERIFVEGFGTLIQVASLFVFQELASKILEFSNFCKPPSAKRVAHYANKYLQLKDVKPEELQAVSRGLKQNFKAVKGIIATQLYKPEDIYGRLEQVGVDAIQALGNIANKSKPPLKELRPQVVLELAQAATRGHIMRLKQASLLTLGAGVLGTAFISGFVIQYLNDHFFSTRVAPRLLRLFGILPKGQSEIMYVKHQLPSIQERAYWI